MNLLKRNIFHPAESSIFHQSGMDKETAPSIRNYFSSLRKPMLAGTSFTGAGWLQAVRNNRASAKYFIFQI
jgi:hypothetical protein